MTLPVRRRILSLGVFVGAGLGLALIPANRSPLSGQRADREATVSAAEPAAPYDWLQMNGDPQHSGNNTQETVLGPGNVASLQFLFQVALPSAADGAPVALSSVVTPGGTFDLLFSTTKSGTLVALDAATGAQIWAQPHAGASSVTNSSPAIDPESPLLSTATVSTARSTSTRSPTAPRSRPAAGRSSTTLKGNVEKVAGALCDRDRGERRDLPLRAPRRIQRRRRRLPGACDGDQPDHRDAERLQHAVQRPVRPLHHVAGLPIADSRRSAIWPKDGILYDAVTDRIYMPTGNGPFDANAGGHIWGDSVLALNPDGTGSGGGMPMDSYTPSNYAALESGDLDLGSTGPAILPAAGYPGRLAVQSGKDSKLRLIDLTDMSGQGGPGHAGGEIELQSLPQGGGVLTVPAVWINPADGTTWVFYSNNSGISALRLEFPGGVPSLVKQWQSSLNGTSPLVVNNVLYQMGGFTLRAMDPLTGGVLWSDTTHVGSRHWQSPVVVNARVYLQDEAGHLTAWGLPPASGTPTATPPSTATNTPDEHPDQYADGHPDETPTRTRTTTPTRTATRTPTVTPTRTPTRTPTSTRRRRPRHRRTPRRHTATNTATNTPTQGPIDHPDADTHADTGRRGDRLRQERRHRRLTRPGSSRASRS